jgi:hypothetical protein
MAEISKQALKVANNTDFPNNSTGYITPELLRGFNTDMIDSTVNQAEYTINSGSWNSSITQLNSFTASQQPTFNALNAFTASQLTINSGVNAATQSLNASVNSLTTEVDSLQNWTSSVNEIRFNNGLPNYAIRWNFGGFISASFVENVGGRIADITVLSDGTKLNTSSFNDYTASAAAAQSAYSASQAIWNASATASISQLLSFSSSLDATYATDAQLASVSSSLNDNINTKLSTSSFNEYTSSFGSLTSLNSFTASINSYTASNNQKWATIGLLTGSYATTGSNVFIGSQLFTGSQTITGSVLGNVVPLTISSQTASMDLSQGNFFTLTLVSGSSTRLSASNIKQGQTVNLLITQASVGSGSLSYDSTFKFTPGNTYTASVASSSKDILTFITFDNSTIYASAIKNLV